MLFVSFYFKGGDRVTEIIEKEIVNIEDMIYEIRGVQVMLDSEISETKCHNYFIRR